MRNAIGFVILLSFLIFPKTTFAGSSCPDWNTIKGGDSRPWPWGAELEIPWLNMDGTWVGSVNNCKSYFKFKMVSMRTKNSRRLWIAQIDPQSCKVLAQGYGTAEGNVVTGQLVNTSGTRFEVTVRSFDSDTLSSSGMGEYGGLERHKVFVLTVTPVGSLGPMVSLEIKKVPASTPPPISCSRAK